MTMGFQLAYGNPEIRILPESADTAGDFAPGDLVYLVAGLVTVAANDATIFGVAQKTATGTANTDIPVSVINTGQTWIAQSNAAQTAANVGEDYDLVVTTLINSVNVGSTSNPAVTVVDLDSRDGAVTAAGGRLLVKFLPGVLQQTKGYGTSDIISTT